MIMEKYAASNKQMVERVNNDIQQQYELLQKMNAEKRKIRAQNIQKGIFAIGFVFLFIYLLSQVLLESVLVKLDVPVPEKVRNFLMLDNEWLRTKYGRSFILVSAGMMLLLGWIFKSKIRSVDITEVQEWLRLFESQLLDIELEWK